MKFNLSYDLGTKHQSPYVLGTLEYLVSTQTDRASIDQCRVAFTQYILTCFRNNYELRALLSWGNSWVVNGLGRRLLIAQQKNESGSNTARKCISSPRYYLPFSFLTAKVSNYIVRPFEWVSIYRCPQDRRSRLVPLGLQPSWRSEHCY